MAASLRWPIATLQDPSAPGHNQAWRALINEYDASLISFFRRSRVSAERRALLVQNTWIRARLGISRLGQDAPIDPWLRRLAKSELQEEWVRDQRERIHAEKIADLYADQSPCVALDELERLAIRSEYEEHLAQLTSDERDFVRMVIEEDLPYEEIARRLSFKRVESVKVKWSRIRAKLRHLAGANRAPDAEAGGGDGR